LFKLADYIEQSRASITEHRAAQYRLWRRTPVFARCPDGRNAVTPSVFDLN
jgi:hypothetical protein